MFVLFTACSITFVLTVLPCAGEGQNSVWIDWSTTTDLLMLVCFLKLASEPKLVVGAVWFPEHR